MSLKELLKQLAPKPGIKTAKGMQTSIDYNNSQWRYSMTMTNNTTRRYLFVLLPGNVHHTRVAEVISSAGDYYFKDLVGQSVKIDNTVDQMPLYIIRNDDYSQLREVIGHWNFLLPSEKATYGWSGGVIQTSRQSLQKDNIVFQSLSGRMTIDDFREYLRNTALKLTQTQVTSSNEQQFSEKIFFTYLTPFKRPVLKDIAITEYYKPSSVQKKAVIDKVMFFAGNMFYAIYVPAQTTTTLTWIFSQEYNQGIYLQDQTENYEILNQLSNNLKTK